MKILFVNTFHHPGGGDRRYLFDLAEELESRGHDIAYFAMEHPRNLDSPWSRYFVSNIHFGRIAQRRQFGDGLRVFKRSIYSSEARSKIRQLVTAFKPDVAHLITIHNHITLAIIPVLKQLGVPIIWGTHGWKLLCPAATPFRDDVVCEACWRHRYYNAIRYRCNKGQLGASLLTGLEAYFNHYVGFYRLVDAYITPSRFMKRKMVEAGFDSAKIHHVPNFIRAMEKKPVTFEKFAIFCGRLVEGKGVETVLRAAGETDNLRIVIVGDGPCRNHLVSLKDELAAEGIEFAGFKEREELFALLRRAAFAIVPSESYENQPYAIIEAYINGKPVIAADIGGIPEIMLEGETGFLFPPGDHVRLAGLIKKLAAEPEMCARMGNAGRQFIQDLCNMGLHIDRLMTIYQSLLSSPVTRRVNEWGDRKE